MSVKCEVQTDEEPKDKEERQVTAVSDTFERGLTIVALGRNHVVNESAIWFMRQQEDIRGGGVKQCPIQCENFICHSS